MRMEGIPVVAFWDVVRETLAGPDKRARVTARKPKELPQKPSIPIIVMGELLDP